MALALPTTAIAADDQKVELPATSRPWTGEDYELVAQAIVQDQIPLPRFSSPTSADLLKRLVSHENLAVQADKRLAITVRLQDFTQVQASVVAILQKYALAAAKGEPVREELVAMMGFALREAASGADLVTEFSPTIPHDAQYETRMKGIEKVRSGLTLMLVGAERSLTDRTLTPADRTLLLTAMADSIGSIEPFLADDVALELISKMKRHRAHASDLDLAAIDQFIRSLESRNHAARIEVLSVIR